MTQVKSLIPSFSSLSGERSGSVKLPIARNLKELFFFYPKLCEANASTLTIYSIGYFPIMTSFYILYNIEKKIKKNLSKVLKTLKNIMENGAFAHRSKHSIFHNIFKYFVIQRRQKALLWSEGLSKQILLFRRKSKIC